MEFIMLIREFFFGVLVAYISFTNSLAIEIGSALPSSRPETEIAAQEESKPESFAQLSDSDVGKTAQIQRFLLEHLEYQQAAVGASDRVEEIAPDDGLPAMETIQNALVNVYCQYKTDAYIRTTTGTGYFINQKGVILTNAHVAQFLLLENIESDSADVDCVIRTGNPAEPKYKAELLYISPTWIFDNAELITTESPRGTGERDYALLYISESVDKTPLPVTFPAIGVDTNLLPRTLERASVLTAGYPAASLIRNGANAKLLPVIASTTIGTLYTFGSNYADIFTVSESPVGEQGASGGPIVMPESEQAIGLIVTKGDESTEGSHSLRALTLSYIDRTIKEETGFSLIQNMQGDLALRGNVFENAMTPFLAQILEDALSQ